MKVALAVPELPSVTVTSSIESEGSRIVVRDRAQAEVVGDRRVRGLERRIVKLSSISSRASPIRATSTVVEVSPGAKVSVPLAAV